MHSVRTTRMRRPFSFAAPPNFTRDAVPTLQQAAKASPSAGIRRDIVWALARIDGPEARAVVREATTDRDAGVRQAAADAVGKSTLNTTQLAALSAALHSVGPVELPRVLPAYEQATDSATGESLVRTLLASSA